MSLVWEGGMDEDNELTGWQLVFAWMALVIGSWAAIFVMLTLVEMAIEYFR